MKIKNKKIFIFLGVIGLFILVIFNLKNKDKKEYYTIKRQDMELAIETSGYVQSKDKANLYFQVAEKINDVLVNEGDKVKKGDLLATVSGDMLDQSLQAARDTRDIAQFEKDLYVEKYGTKMDSVGGEKEYYRQLRIYDENISKTNAQYNQSLINSQKSAIIAPFDGTIGKVYINKGDLSSLNSPAIEIQDISKPTFYTDISEVDIAHVDINDKVEITFDAFPDKVFTGYVYSINPVAENTHGVAYYKAEIKADTLPEKLRIGMSADINILAEKKEGVLYLPLYFVDNVTADSGSVLVISNNVVTKKDIKIGLNNYNGVEVVHGLSEGDTVIYYEINN